MYWCINVSDLFMHICRAAYLGICHGEGLDNFHNTHVWGVSPPHPLQLLFIK